MPCAFKQPAASHGVCWVFSTADGPGSSRLAWLRCPVCSHPQVSSVTPSAAAASPAVLLFGAAQLLPSWLSIGGLPRAASRVACARQAGALSASGGAAIHGGRREAPSGNTLSPSGHFSHHCSREAANRARASCDGGCVRDPARSPDAAVRGEDDEEEQSRQGSPGFISQGSIWLLSPGEQNCPAPETLSLPSSRPSLIHLQRLHHSVDKTTVVPPVWVFLAAPSHLPSFTLSL